MNRCIKIVRWFKQVFKAYDGQRIEGGKKRSSFHPNVSANKRKNTETFFLREVSYSQNFAFCGRVWELNPCKKQGMSDSVRISVYTCSFNLICRK
jgi:hypothetical protein